MHWNECDGRRARPYRARNGMLLGVCRGLAEHWGLSVFWTRVLVVALAVFTAFWPVMITYLVVGLLLRPEPRYLVAYRDAPSPATRARRAMAGLDDRLRGLEARAARGCDWDDRLENGW